ncbi:MAG: exosortase/archaeosortase family protein [Phycisphaeraceae bacterium]|nr:exosortase/archaeosortase family protein [Phycisphaeraceae bacterium]MCW5753213.1 exosortase/archaeosortase family protein [Phycisphaeraceae bacterium]
MSAGSASTHATISAATASTPARIGGLFTREGLWATALLATAFAAYFYRWFLQQGLMSSKNIDDWGHAFVIPLISGYVLWKRRDEIVRTPIETFWPGMIAVCLGLYCYLFFLVGVPNHMLAGGAMLLCLFGLVLTVCGTRMMRHIFLPLAFLAFGVTISESIMILVTFKLQQISSSGAFLVLSLLGGVMGFAVDISGNVLTVIEASGERHEMNVAEACSGIRMVVAFIALSGAVAMLSCREWWKRLSLLALSVPVSVVMNVIRVTVLGLLTLVDANLAEGEAHTLIGTLLLIPALGLFVLVSWVLNTIVKPQAEGGAA